MAFGRGKTDTGDKAPKKRGLFFHKSNDEVDEVDEKTEELVSNPVSRSRKKKRKRGKNDMMASVLRETVKTTVVADMKANERFHVKRDGTTYYVGWLLDVADIGGLSKRMAKDEDKGSIIEGINRGSIKVLITAALMAEEKICFVPDVETLDMMGEYTILRNAPYKTMFVSAPDGKVINLDGAVNVSLQDAFKIASGDVDIEDLLADYGCYWAQGGYAVDEFSDDDMVVGVSDTAFGADVDDSELVDEDIDEESVDVAASEPSVAVLSDAANAQMASDGLDDFEFDDFEDENNEAPSGVVSAPGAKQYNPQMSPQAAPQAPSQQNRSAKQISPSTSSAGTDAHDAEEDFHPQNEVELSADEYREQLSRSWYSTDLDLELDMGAFEDSFGSDTVFAVFDTDRPTDGSWMGEYLNQLSREANDDIRAMHQANIAQLRERYQRMMSNYIVALTGMLAMNVDLADEEPLPNTYAQEFDVIKRTRHERSSEIEVLAQRERENIDADYERRRKAAMDAAANSRGQEFDKRYGPDNDRKKANIETKLRANFDNEYNESWRRINDRRIEEAKRRMDYGVNGILNDLQEQYRQMMDLERERYELHRQAIAEWIDENRRQDIDFVAATLEEQRQMEKSEVISREMTEKLRQQQEEFERRKAALESDIVSLRQRNEDALAEAKASYERTVSDVKVENERLRRRESDLLDRYKNLDDEKSMEYGKRMKELEDQLEAERLRYDALMNQGKRSNVVWIGFIVVSAIAAGCIGVVFGLHQSIDYTMAASSTSMLLPFLP